MFQFCFKIGIVIFVSLSAAEGGDFGAARSNDECLIPDGGRGICKKIYDCEPLLGLLIKGRSRPQPWVIDFLRRSHCGFEGKDPVVCCPVAVKPKDNHVNLNLTIKDPVFEKFLNKSCGQIQTLDKVFGGTATESHEFPWMALIGYRTRFNIQFRCGGSLISHRYVLTAAHCVSTSSDIYPTLVRLGEHNLESSEQYNHGKDCSPPVKDIPIEEVIAHPDYFKPELRNDIALIRLAKRVEYQDNIRPICLPIKKDWMERSLPDDKAIMAGWGATDSGLRSSVLRKVTLPIIPLSECSKIYNKKVPITESQICAGGEPGKDSCSGDSGGPLKAIGINPAGEPAYIQHGIVSFGSKICGAKGMPGVYTKVAYYVDWIVKNVKE